MTSRKTSEPSPESVARANRQRLAQEEGLRAMADVAKDAVAIRKNMDRLRALRSREAEQGALPPLHFRTLRQKEEASPQVVTSASSGRRKSGPFLRPAINRSIMRRSGITNH
jgi:hypothetical protein